MEVEVEVEAGQKANRRKNKTHSKMAVPGMCVCVYTW